ncbi:hypothetical protein [Anaerorhabdus sp.]|uniref:hypothetical protein n=1 Tax=Anaerorhabdus sp. TaxID=1872524 RepID=UPI002FC6FF30
MKKMKPIIFIFMICLLIDPINTFAKDSSNYNKLDNIDELSIEPRIYTVDVEQSCEIVQYEGYDEDVENCTYRKLSYWNGYNRTAHRGREITTAQDRESGYRRFLVTYTYEIY